MGKLWWIKAGALALLCASSVRADLKIENIQAAYGRFGPVRKTLTVHEQDEIFFYFDIVGAQTDKQGKIDQTIRVEIADPTGKTILNKENSTPKGQTLGGGRLPGVAFITFGSNLTPGFYTLKVTAIDHLSGDEASFRRGLNYQPGGFHIVSPQFFYDADGKFPAPTGGVTGQTLHLRLNAVGLDPQAERLDTSMTLEVLDSKGERVFPDPLVAEFHENDTAKIRKIPVVNFKASFALTRPGDFTVRIHVEDRVGMRSEKFEAPLHVAALPVEQP